MIARFRFVAFVASCSMSFTSSLLYLIELNFVAKYNFGFGMRPVRQCSLANFIVVDSIKRLDYLMVQNTSVTRLAIQQIIPEH